MSTSTNSTSRSYECVVRFEPKLIWPVLMITAALASALVYFGLSRIWIITVCIVFLVIGVSILWNPVIEPSNGVVRERAKLFGKAVLAERVTSLSEFSEIFCELHERDPDEIWVGIRHKNGRVLWVRSASASPRAAEELAWRICSDTGLKLKGEPA